MVGAGLIVLLLLLPVSVVLAVRRVRAGLRAEREQRRAAALDSKVVRLGPQHWGETEQGEEEAAQLGGEDGESAASLLTTVTIDWILLLHFYTQVLL